MLTEKARSIIEESKVILNDTFSLIIEGYSCAEAVSYLFFEEYNARMRKKIERMKRKFKIYLESENFFLFPVTNDEKLRHI